MAGIEKLLLVFEELTERWLAGIKCSREIIQRGVVKTPPSKAVAAGLAAVGQRRLDAVKLDINLGGELSFPIADKLLSAGTPSSITTGYEDRVIPGRVAGRPRVAEPVTASMLVGQLHDLIQSEDGE